MADPRGGRVVFGLERRAGQPRPAMPTKQTPPTQKPALDAMRSAEFEILLSYDYDAVIDYLHNKHGLAMTQRFEGHVRSRPRRIAQSPTSCRCACGGIRLANSTTNADYLPMSRSRLLERLINTQERLGDCNLFGDPDLARHQGGGRRLPPSDRLCSDCRPTAAISGRPACSIGRRWPWPFLPRFRIPSMPAFCVKKPNALLETEIRGRSQAALVTLSVLPRHW